MSAVVCPWCQSEILQEEGDEAEQMCPFCDNELGGYRTMTIQLGDDESDADGAAEEDEDLSWLENEAEADKSEALWKFEETVERLLDEQETTPTCAHCQEYMVAAGTRIVTADGFEPRTPKWLGQAVLNAPFKLQIFVCPSCFSLQQVLDEGDQREMTNRFSSFHNARS